MSVDPDDLSSVVRYALESTRATAVCPFHLDVAVRFGDDAAESHAYARARNITKSAWPGHALTWQQSIRAIAAEYRARAASD